LGRRIATNRTLLQDLCPQAGDLIPVRSGNGGTQWHYHCLGQPTTIDLIEAEIAAKKLLAETAAKEARFLERKLYFLRQPAPKN
jgi:hypothetical protein